MNHFEEIEWIVKKLTQVGLHAESRQLWEAYRGACTGGELICNTGVVLRNIQDKTEGEIRKRIEAVLEYYVQIWK